MLYINIHTGARFDVYKVDNNFVYGVTNEGDLKIRSHLFVKNYLTINDYCNEYLLTAKERIELDIGLLKEIASFNEPLNNISIDNVINLLGIFKTTKNIRILLRAIKGLMGIYVDTKKGKR